MLPFQKQLSPSLVRRGSMVVRQSGRSQNACKTPPLPERQLLSARSGDRFWGQIYPGGPDGVPINKESLVAPNGHDDLLRAREGIDGRVLIGLDEGLQDEVAPSRVRTRRSELARKRRDRHLNFLEGMISGLGCDISVLLGDRCGVGPRRSNATRRVSGRRGLALPERWSVPRPRSLIGLTSAEAST